METDKELSKIFKLMAKLPDELIIFNDYDSFTISPIVELNQEQLSEQELSLMLDVVALEEKSSLPFIKTPRHKVEQDSVEAVMICHKVSELLQFTNYPEVDIVQKLYSKKRKFYKRKRI